MGSTLDFAEYIAGQIDSAGEVSYRKMFCEYAFYVNGKVVALLCDNQLYIKPTEGGRLFIGDVVEAPPYPGAKNCFLIDDKISDKQWLTHLVKITENELPLPVKKIKKKR